MAFLSAWASQADSRNRCVLHVAGPRSVAGPRVHGTLFPPAGRRPRDHLGAPDPILAQAAAEAGAEIRMATKVTALVEDRGRVAGVRVAHAGSESALIAAVVVGADGRNSTIAALVGARKYNLTSNERFGYWTFFEALSRARIPRSSSTVGPTGWCSRAPPTAACIRSARSPIRASFRVSARLWRAASWSTPVVAGPLRRRCRVRAAWGGSSGCCAGRGSSGRRPVRAGRSLAMPANSRTPPRARGSGTRSDRSTRLPPRS
jgi:2-polyprenyl-6-methoxyphenol hydroxylase-like FAD-dependent oxidoreductase